MKYDPPGHLVATNRLVQINRVLGLQQLGRHAHLAGKPSLHS